MMSIDIVMASIGMTGLYSYGLHSYGIYSHRLYSYGPAWPARPPARPRRRRPAAARAQIGRGSTRHNFMTRARCLAVPAGIGADGWRPPAPFDAPHTTTTTPHPGPPPARPPALTNAHAHARTLVNAHTLTTAGGRRTLRTPLWWVL